MKTIIAQNSWFVESDLRLDASYHLSDTNRIKHVFSNTPYQFSTIEKQSERIFSGNIFRRTYVKDPERGIPYITGSDMIKLDINSGKYLSKKQAVGLQNLMLKKGWILVTCSGTLGNTVYTNDLFANKIATHDLIRIIPNNNDTMEGFLYAFLTCKYGFTLLTQSSYGGVVKHIEPHHIANIPVPILPPEQQLKINNLVFESAELRVEANLKLKEVEELFSTHLNIVRFNTNNFQTGSRKLSEVQASFQLRLDAPAFINPGVKLIETLKNKFDFKELGKCEVQVSRPGIFKRVYVKSGGFPYIKGSELGLNNPFNNCVRLSKSKTPFLEKLRLCNNQILVTCAGSVGNIRIITKEFEDQNAIGSQDIIRINSNSKLFTNEYIFAYLRLPFIFDFIQSMKYGSVIERVEPFHIDQIPILVPTQEFSELITQKIVEYKELTYTAFCKENQAIQLVEKEIEQWQN